MECVLPRSPLDASPGGVRVFARQQHERLALGLQLPVQLVNRAQRRVGAGHGLEEEFLLDPLDLLLRLLLPAALAVEAMRQLPEGLLLVQLPPGLIHVGQLHVRLVAALLPELRDGSLPEAVALRELRIDVIVADVLLDEVLRSQLVDFGVGRLLLYLVIEVALLGGQFQRGDHTARRELRLFFQHRGGLRWGGGGEAIHARACCGRRGGREEEKQVTAMDGELKKRRRARKKGSCHDSSARSKRSRDGRGARKPPCADRTIRTKEQSPKDGESSQFCLEVGANWHVRQNSPRRSKSDQIIRL